MNTTATADFISAAKNAHGNKYSYDKSVYNGNASKLIVTCPKHGDFMVSPNNHVGKRSGCPECYKDSRKPSSEKLRNRLKVIYGDKYNFDKVVYDPAKPKGPFTITCPIHGDIETTFKSLFVRKRGCTKCIEDNKRKESEDAFIAKSTKIHNGKYDYSKVVYAGVETPVTIICPVHGEFEQTPHGHMKGYGCYKCGRESHATKVKMTPEEYFRRAKAVHGNKYDYSKSKYIGIDKDITITCPVHGDFTQRADGHLKYGCEQCSHDRKILTTEEWITRAKEIHGARYDYSKSVYSDGRDLITIICPDHGEVKVIASEHISNRTNRKAIGCPICTSSKPERVIYDWLSTTGLEFKKEFKLPEHLYRYDFCIPKMKILIEYDGGYHYVVNDRNDEIKLDGIKKRDLIKNELAKIYGYSLIRLPYTIKLDNLVDELKRRIMKVIKYEKDGKYYRSFLDFATANQIPGDAKSSDYDNYLFRF